MTKVSPRCVVLESPYAGDTSRNVRYALQCMRYALAKGEAPYLSHLLYPHVLNDNVAEERELGLCASNAWLAHCDYVVLCCDLGISGGMQRAARASRRPVYLRWINAVRDDVALMLPPGIEPDWNVLAKM